jgi:hypothetical protein
MKRLIGSDFGFYDFDPVARTVTIFDTPSFTIGQVLLVTNVTAGKIIYSFADSNLSGTLSKNVITLAYDTSLMKITDNLQIYIDFPDPLSFDKKDDLTNVSKSGKPLDISEISEVMDGLLDNRPGSLNVNVSPMGLTNPGQQPASQSIPVALANEQVQDKYITSVCPIGRIGNNALTQDGSPIDCLQYRSISFHVVGSNFGLTFEISNDGINWIGTSLADRYNGNIQTSSISSANNRMYYGSMEARYFRARLSIMVTSGPLYCSTMLRMTPYTNPHSLNLAAVLGYSPPSAGVSGMLSVGGNVGPGLAATANPLAVGGVDTAGKIRRFLSDVTGNQAVNGPDPVQGQRLNPIQTVDGSAIGMAHFEVLNRILIELRNISYYLQEMPLFLNNGKQFNDDVASFSDELRIQN